MKREDILLDSGISRKKEEKKAVLFSDTEELYFSLRFSVKERLLKVSSENISASLPHWNL